MWSEIHEKKAELSELCRRFQVKRLEVFGSAVTGEFKPESSDLDFLVEFQPVPRGGLAGQYFGLLAALEGLFGRSVDLVELAAVDNPYFLAEVKKSRVPLYAA